MNRFGKIFIASLICVQVFSCTCTHPLKVTPIQKSDKKLSCKEVILEINESEHYKDLAKKESGIHFGNILMPVCWVTSSVDASKAVAAANERIKYLGKIYDVLDCGGKTEQSDKNVAAAPFVAPPIIQIQPVQNSAEPLYDGRSLSTQSGKPAQCKTPEEIKKYTHQHIDKLGRVYTHCHINTGPHRHLDDL